MTVPLNIYFCNNATNNNNNNNKLVVTYIVHYESKAGPLPLFDLFWRLLKAFLFRQSVCFSTSLYLAIVLIA